MFHTIEDVYLQLKADPRLAERGVAVTMTRSFIECAVSADKKILADDDRIECCMKKTYFGKQYWMPQCHSHPATLEELYETLLEELLKV